MLSLLLLVCLTTSLAQPLTHQEALAAHAAAENAVRAAAGQQPQTFSHDEALRAHAAAEANVRAQAALFPPNPNPVVGPSGNIGPSGIVGSSGNIGPSGLCGPSGCVAFGK